MSGPSSPLLGGPSSRAPGPGLGTRRSRSGPWPAGEDEAPSHGFRPALATRQLHRAHEDDQAAVHAEEREAPDPLGADGEKAMAVDAGRRDQCEDGDAPAPRLRSFSSRRAK